MKQPKPFLGVSRWCEKSPHLLQKKGLDYFFLSHLLTVCLPQNKVTVGWKPKWAFSTYQNFTVWHLSSATTCIYHFFLLLSAKHCMQWAQAQKFRWFVWRERPPPPVNTADLTLPWIAVQAMQLWLGYISGGLQAHVPAGGDSATARPQGWGSKLHPRDDLLQNTKPHGHMLSWAAQPTTLLFLQACFYRQTFSLQAPGVLLGLLPQLKNLMAAGGLPGVTGGVGLPRFKGRFDPGGRPDPALSVKGAHLFQLLSVLFSKAHKHLLSCMKVDPISSSPGFMAKLTVKYVSKVA